MQLSKYIRLTRLNQPAGIWLLFLPCLFGIALSLKNISNINPSETLWIIFLFFSGSIIMRSAGCVINDILDQKFDAKIERTKPRPLASKEVSTHEALILTAILLIIGLVILLQLNFKVILSGFVALLLVATYPLMKRVTYYPQVFLGLTFNFGILMASLQIHNTITIEAIILYFTAMIWTVIYDTIYAYQDIKDDLKTGVKSTAIRFKEDPKKILKSLNFIMFMSFLVLGWKSHFSAEFFLTIFLLDLFLNKKIKDCDFDNPQKCLKVFKANIWAGFLILIAILLG